MQPKTPQQKPYVKVARCIVDEEGREFIKPLGNGGEAQLWEVRIWNQYLQFLNDNPKARGSVYYPWTFIEYLDKPTIDLSEVVLLPEVTNGKEFQIVQTK